MAISSPLQTSNLLGRSPKISTNSFPVWVLGRAGDRHITGTITRKEFNSTTLLTEAPYRYVIALTLLFAPSIYNGLTEGSSPQSVAVVLLAVVLFIGAILGLENFRAQRRISEVEASADATHVARGVLIGAGPLTAKRPQHVGLYVTNHGAILVTERRGDRVEHRVDRVDLTATPKGRVFGCAFIIDGTQYALRAIRGQIAPT